jgi:hypothetical protein
MAGKLVPVSRSEAEEGLTLDALPPGMVTEPSLLWTLDAPRAGSVTVRLSYLSEGFELEGDHRMVLDEDDAVLSGGFVVANQTGLTLPYDKLTLVAGAIHLAGDRRRVDRLNPSPGAAKGGEVSRFGDLHRWTVPTSGVLPTGASVAVPVIEAVSGKAERFYEYDATIFDERVTSKLTVPYQVPVPSGNVRLYEKRGGDLLFTASDRVDDTPAGSPMELTIAQVFDITAERTRIHEAPREEGGTVQRMEVVLGNSFDRDVEVRVLERLFGDWEVSWAKLEGEELEAERVDARTARFDVSIPEGETVTLRYEILYER